VKLLIVHRIFLISSLLFSVGVAAQNSTSQTQANVRNSASSKPATAQSDEGEKRFQTQCGRCHAPPEDLSPREARAVVRQMRVRANLTAEDERLILKYLAP
jgi:cytochrome c5